MYIVTKNNPYCPEVAYFDSFEDAMYQHSSWVAEHHSEDGKHPGKITVAKVITTTDIKTLY